MHAHNLIPFPNQLAALESEAEAQLEASKQSFLEFVATLQVIQDSALWQKDYPTWRDYLKTRWGLSDSTLRVKRMHARYAETIMSIVANAAFSETDVRKVKARLSSLTDDKELQAATYALAYKETNHIVPTDGELKAAYEAVYDVHVRDVYTHDGIDYSMRQIAKSNMASVAITENKARQSLHIDVSQGVESKQFEGTKAEIMAFLASAPDTMFKLYWKESRK